MNQTIVLFGPPGCGKGTQAALIKAKLGIPHISTGDMFRDHKRRETELGKQVAEILSTGSLVPDSVTNAMVRERLARADAAKGALLDGYPRNTDQARELEMILEGSDRRIDAVVLIEVPDDEVVARIRRRGEQSGRLDDVSEAVVRYRLSVYKAQSRPCVAYYERAGVTIYKIDGLGTVEQVTARILEALGVEG